MNSVRTENWFQRLPFVFCLIIVCMYVYCEWGNLFLATFHSIALHFVISYHFWKYFGGHSTTKSGNDENRVRWTEYMYYGKSAMFTPNIFFLNQVWGERSVLKCCDLIICVLQLVQSYCTNLFTWIYTIVYIWHIWCELSDRTQNYNKIIMAIQ